MTLGKKLSSYRKIAGLTQQQLGEHLNLSAQAISKWENDLAEPDLSALRALAELYKVSVDELLDLDATSIDIAGAEQAEENETPAANTAAMPIGFCKGCGIAVTEENLGTSDPVILCEKCLNAKNEEKKRIEQQKKQAEAKRIYEEKARREENARKLKRGMIWHFIVAALAAGLFLSAMIGVLAEEFSVGMLVGALIGTGIVFCLVFCLFYECWVNDVVFEWTSKAFQAPGLIFTFDLDGCLWLIGMKLLFWAIGVLFSLACGAIGIAIASVISPFVFPYVIYHIRKSIKTGEECEVV